MHYIISPCPPIRRVRACVADGVVRREQRLDALLWVDDDGAGALAVGAARGGAGSVAAAAGDVGALGAALLDEVAQRLGQRLLVRDDHLGVGGLRVERVLGAVVVVASTEVRREQDGVGVGAEGGGEEEGGLARWRRRGERESRKGRRGRRGGRRRRWKGGKRRRSAWKRKGRRKPCRRRRSLPFALLFSSCVPACVSPPFPSLFHGRVVSSQGDGGGGGGGSSTPRLLRLELAKERRGGMA